MGDKFTDNIEYRIAQGEMRASEVYTKMMGYFGKDKARIKELEEQDRATVKEQLKDDEYIGELQDRIKELEEGIQFLLSFMPNTIVTKGLDPTFYYTGTYEGDLDIQNRIELLKGGSND